jgi:hypothetical protein
LPIEAKADPRSNLNALLFSLKCQDVHETFKLPAGNYKVVQPDADADILQIENRGDRRSVFVDFEPTESRFPHRNSAVTFDKYGDTNYLGRVWLDGQQYGIKVDPGRVETAAEANATQHAAAVGGQ